MGWPQWWPVAERSQRIVKMGVHKRFKRWSDGGIWQIIFNTLVEAADMEWVMIDLTIIRAHQHSAGAKGGRKIRH